MIPAAFAYQRPATVDEALRAIAADPEAKVLAGGHSLLPLLKLRLARTDTLIDIGRLQELKGLRYAADGSATIGAADDLRRAGRDHPARLRARRHPA